MKMMLKEGLKLNNYIYTEFINSCRTKEHLDRSAQILHFLESENTSPENFLAPLNCFMGKCIELGYADMAMEKYQMLLQTSRPDDRTYLSLIKGCVFSETKRFDLATQLFNEMKKNGMTVAPAIYELMLHQFKDPQQIDAGMEILVLTCLVSLFINCLISFSFSLSSFV